ncbi:MAG TPA: histidine phosphatase family protein [Acidimicrobiales bacterium]|nr:histidine phosphatase family protein [Acidimicrobiales bacterium]
MLLIVRHGQTQANADGLILGRADPPLTDLGRRQAAALARALPAPARVVSSPLRRAQETASAFGGPVETDDRWIELDYGQMDGTPAASIGDDLWARWRADPDFAPPGGESLRALGTRVRAGCDELAGEAAERDIVVVSHVSPIKAAVAWVLGVGDEVGWKLFVEDAAVCRIGIGPFGPVLTAFNERHPPPG